MAETLKQHYRRRMKEQSEAAANGNRDEPNKSNNKDNTRFGMSTPIEDIVLIDLDLLHPYSKHPFKLYGEEKLTELAESIKRDGLQQPIIIRIVEDKPGFEILAGHNRVAAMRLLGKRDIPAIIRIIDDSSAALVAVSTNLEQREKLLPSEKAFAYKLQMEVLQNKKKPAIKNGKSSSVINESQAGYQIDTLRKGEILSSSSEDSYAHIFRYIHLTLLIPELLDLLDQDRFPMMAGYEISFLDESAQQSVLQYFFSGTSKDKLSLKNAVAIRAAYESGVMLTNISSFLHKPVKKKGPVTYKFSRKALRKEYALPDDFDLMSFIHEKLREVFGHTGKAI